MWISGSFLEALLEPKMRMRQVFCKSGSRCTQLRSHGQCAMRVIIWMSHSERDKGPAHLISKFQSANSRHIDSTFQIVEKSSLMSTPLLLSSSPPGKHCHMGSRHCNRAPIRSSVPSMSSSLDRKVAFRAASLTRTLSVNTLLGIKRIDLFMSPTSSSNCSRQSVCRERGRCIVLHNLSWKAS